MSQKLLVDDFIPIQNPLIPVTSQNSGIGPQKIVAVIVNPFATLL